MEVYDSKGDNNLYNDIESISRQIKDVYDEILYYDLEGNITEKNKAIGNLKRLRYQEKELYKTICSKKNRAMSFFILTSKIYELNTDYSDLYNETVPSIYDFKQAGRRMLMRLQHNFREEIDTASYESAKRRNENDQLLQGIFNYAHAHNKISNMVIETVYDDVLNVFLCYLEDEINDPKNIEIRDHLLKSKYYILMCNPELEDRYINKDFKIDNKYHVGHNLLFELDQPKESAINRFYKTHFQKAIDYNTVAIMTMSEQKLSPGIKRFIIIYETMLKSILEVTNDTCKHDIIKTYEDYKSCHDNTNISGNGVINRVLADNKKHKVLKMSFKKENISE